MGILLAIWFSSVVAMGPTPGGMGFGSMARQSQAEGRSPRDRALERTQAPHASKTEAYCNDAEKPKDCIIALRSAEAAERQANFAQYSFLATAAAVMLSFVGLLLVKWTLDATRLAAVGAAKSADVAERSLKITQRAYLSVEPLGIRMRRDGQSWFAHIGVRNAGLLPARDVQWQISIETATADNDWKDFLYVYPRRGNHVIPPGTTMRRGSRPFFVDHRKRDNAMFTYVWGEVTYTDGFGIERFTKFCHRYNHQAIVSHREGGAWVPPEDARYHDYGNEAT